MEACRRTYSRGTAEYGREWEIEDVGNPSKSQSKSHLLVLTSFDCLQKPEERQRIWWCCHGEFSFLPIHAAGIYHGDSQVCLSDFFISSYTPTVSALLDAKVKLDSRRGGTDRPQGRDDARGREGVRDEVAELAEVHEAEAEPPVVFCASLSRAKS